MFRAVYASTLVTQLVWDPGPGPVNSLVSLDLGLITLPWKCSASHNVASGTSTSLLARGCWSRPSRQPLLAPTGLGAPVQLRCSGLASQNQLRPSL